MGALLDEAMTGLRVRGLVEEVAQRGDGGRVGVGEVSHVHLDSLARKLWA